MNHVKLSVLINIVYLRITGLIMSAHPFIRDSAHVFDGAIADPGHEFTVKLELRPWKYINAQLSLIRLQIPHILF
ncbi:hypothetical protein [Janthinobacterium sp. EB271-G4-3-2]|uniref:hypothetical protein n=1 Tax=Janthinobacterium sp. EB271-G4-3-2 TaxID=2775058 RepID=UPI001E35C8A7|nr:MULTISPECIES: hypothetical protein [unclassified Janthinobacterium]MCC7641945.1 hypothetical protein [Janthinobacterium sp. EB271-G4-3-1]MCC7690071.1 hypothetical protein [Janthinobacterium sp. EB271-G4-3-2]